MTMKLSEAIREGSKLHPASESGWSDVGADGQVRTCAMVAAAEAAGIFQWCGGKFIPGVNHIPMLNFVDQRTGDQPGLSARMPSEWEIVAMALELPPCACAKFNVKDQVMAIIWHLHDVHRWSREAVAEWIGTVETTIEDRIAQNERAARAVVDDLRAKIREARDTADPAHVSGKR